MIRRFGISAAVISALALTAGIALGAVTFHSGPDLTFNTPAGTATATFNVSGLGNDPAYAFLDITGTATYTCRNHGKNFAPGHPNVGTSGSSGPQKISNSQKNGRDDISVTASLTAPTPPTAQDIGCPNPAGNWTVVLESLTVDSATLRIEQPLGNVIYGPVTFHP
jgi:hypothetical protein